MHFMHWHACCALHFDGDYGFWCSVGVMFREN